MAFVRLEPIHRVLVAFDIPRRPRPDQAVIASIAIVRAMLNANGEPNGKSFETRRIVDLHLIAPCSVGNFLHDSV